MEKTETESEIEIRNLHGDIRKVSLRPDRTVGELKRILQQEQHLLPTQSFHLFLRGSKLKPEDSIQSLQLREQDFIILAPYIKKTQSTVVSNQNNPDSSGSRSKFELHELSENASAKNAPKGREDNDVSSLQETKRMPLNGILMKEHADRVWDMIAADLAVWQAAVENDVDVSNIQSKPQKEIKRRRNICMPDSGNEYQNESSYENGGFSMEKRRETVRQSKKARNHWFFPPILERSYRIFKSLNLVYGFLQKQHIQATWKNMKIAVQQLYGDSGNEIMMNDIEMMAILFPKLLQISNRTGQGDDESFNIDLLDPSNIPEEDRPRSLHEVMPIKLQTGIGPSDFLPSIGTKEIPDSLIKSSIRKRLSAFESALPTLMKLFQEEFMKGKQSWNEGDFTLDDLLKFVSKSHRSNLREQLDMALPRPPLLNKKLTRCMDMTDFSAAEMIEHLKQGFGSLGQMVHCEIIKQRDATYGQLAFPLSDPTMAALQRLHISKFYTHQAEAINAAIHKHDVMIVTSTSSGKSICYNVPVLESLFTYAESCALYLFPTKALAQDQYKTLLGMTNGLDPIINMGVYDGDSPQCQRLYLRNNARLLITNPDMLHIAILPSHRQFERMLSNLRYVVVDEAHAYKGAFGCHTSLILRRLRRLCYHLHGITPTFIVSSATVANPREHAMELIGLKTIQVVDKDGSPSGLKYFVLWNPPSYYTSKNPHKEQDSLQKNKHKMKTEKQSYAKKSSPIVEASSLLSEMIQHNLRCISFCKTRKLSELVLNYTREILKETSPSLQNLVQAYRAGYTAQERRKIESELFSGNLRAVAATNALELGIDVGNIDATIHLGFPGSMASLWQQAGRSGRREKSSLSIYVAFESPHDQYFMKHPEKLFSQSIEHAHVDSSNPQVLDEHIGCAAVEYPVDLHYDSDFFGSGLQGSILRLLERGVLGREPTCYSNNNSLYYIGKQKSPAQSVSIRAIDREKYTVVNQATNEVIEEVEESKAFFEVYEGAVYIHQGQTYLVKKLDLETKVAFCQLADVKYYTKTRDMTDVHVLGGQFVYPRGVIKHKKLTSTAQASLCKVTTQWIGFRRIWQGTNKSFDSVELFLPNYSYESQAAWIRVPDTVKKRLDEKELSFRAGLHAASHALLNVIPMYISCNTSDLGTECVNPHDTRYFPQRLLVFDRHPGGIGMAAQVQLLFAEILQAAFELVISCKCAFDVGCPNCVQYLACSEYNEVINKAAAIDILKCVIEAEDSYRQQISCTDDSNKVDGNRYELVNSKTRNHQTRKVKGFLE